MKKIIIILLCSIPLIIRAQYVPNTGTVSNKPYAPAQAVPTDSRSMFYDATNFIWRPYQSTAEVLSYLSVTKYRSGNYIIVVDSGGTLNSNGTYTGGVNTFWMFKDGTADGNLVEMNLFGSSGGTGTVTNVTSTAGGGITLGITSGTTTPNITPSVTLGGDISGSTLSAVTVAKLNGQLPSYYLNYNNLTNTPSIPAQFNPIAGTNITLTGSYPNITFNATAGVTTAGTDMLLTGGNAIVNLDTLHYRKVDSMYATNDSTLTYTLNGLLYNVQLRGGHGAGGGGGSGTVTSVSVVTANGVSGVVSNPTSTPAITLTLGAITPSTVNGLTLSALATGFSIAGGTVSKTLTVSGTGTLSGNNSGDVTLAGESYLSIVNQVITANAVNLSGTNVTGTLAAARMPALTGDVTTSAGTVATTIGNNVVTYAKMQQVAAHSYLGNNTGVLANVAAITNTQLTADLNLFTTTLQGLVPAPGSVAGKVLSDNGTWVINGTGNTNSNIGGYYRWAVPNTNNIKTIAPGYGILIDSTTNANALTVTADTTKLALKGADTIILNNVGNAGLALAYTTSGALNIKKLQAGANITLTQNADSSITITAAGGGGGGITSVGAFDSQVPSTNGGTISGTVLYFQSADATHPGMVNTVAQTISGAKTFSSAPFFSTLTTPGGIFYGGTAGVLQQTSAGSTTTVLHGGVSPTYGAVVLTTDVSGVLPTANGGTGTATPGMTAGAGISITGSFPNYTIANTTLGTVTSVNVSGGTTGLTASGGPVTVSGTITLGGTLVPANGGTGLSSLTPYAVLAGGATPTGTLQQVSGTGVVGQVLTSNGAGFLPSWQNAVTGFTNPMTSVGDLIVGTTGGAAVRLGIGTAGQILTVSGGTAVWSNPQNSVGRDSVITITSGTSSTVTNGCNVVQFNPASVMSTYILTLPTTWHTSNDLLISFGGTITAGNPVVTTLTIVNGSGQTLLQAITPTTANAGEIIRYHLIGTFDQRIN